MTATTNSNRARNRRRRERELRRRQPAPAGRRRWLSLPVLSAVALVGGGLLVALALLTGSRPSSLVPPSSFVPPAGEAPAAGTYAGVPADGFVLGQADAPVTVDLYEDFQCPACRRWGELVFPSLVANELADGTARLVFHDFAFIGPESFDAARAGHAAANQGRFWEFWATMYASQGAENSGALAAPRLIEMARALGLDVERFKADMAPGAAGPAVDAANADAQRLGINSTPTVVINGQQLRGGGYDQISAAIADAAGD